MVVAGEQPDYDDPAVEEAWIEERREEVFAYVRQQRLDIGEVGEWPAWHVPPVVSIWAIESASTPGAIGWWVICGDLPTDYVSGFDAADPRAAVRLFARRWSEAAASMLAGHSPSDVRIGSTAQERLELAPLLKSRAAVLQQWAEQDEVWADLFDDDGND